MVIAYEGTELLAADHHGGNELWGRTHSAVLAEITVASGHMKAATFIAISLRS